MSEKRCYQCGLFSRCLQTGCVVVNGVHEYQPEGDTPRTYWPLTPAQQLNTPRKPHQHDTDDETSDDA